MTNITFGIGNSDRSEYTNLLDPNGVVRLNLSRQSQFGMNWPTTSLDLSIYNRSSLHSLARAEADFLSILLFEADRYNRDRFRTDTIEGPYWLYRAIAGEQTLRKYITRFEGERHENDGLYLDPLNIYGNNGISSNYSIGLHPLWEELNSRSNAMTTSQERQYGALGFLPSGNALNRLKQVAISMNTYVADIERLWVGVNPNYRNVTALYSPVVDLQSGSTVYTTGIDGTSTTGTVQSNVVQINYGVGSGYHIVCSTKLSNFTTNFTRYMGRHLLIARYRLLGSGSTAKLGFMSSYWNVSTVSKFSTASQPIFITSTGTEYKVAPLGFIDFPQSGDRTAYDEDDIGNQIIYMLSERISGSDDLYLDSLYLVPAAHMVAINNADIDNSGREVRILTYPDDTVEAYNYQGVGNYYDARPATESWGLPYEGGTLVVVHASANDVHYASTRLQVDVDYVNRYRVWGRGP